MKINIPPAALEAGCSAYTAVIYRGNGTITEFREAIRAACEAVLAAWPGAAVCHYTIGDNEGYEMVLPLPFPQEGGDE